ncbi:MAG TPA: L,D-transpeptidase [Ktedonobacteraceae bacterium]|jgi:lipoprotein-anchoring transpeptidase ErfK/SrfK|nr:L,D-transpeptidase [Ktedonobacteraceae bacterium]
MAHSPAFRRHMRKSLLATIAALLVMVLLSACNGNPQTQQQANQYKADLDQALSQAQSIGVPDSMLQPIRQQEVQLSQTKAPLSLFSDQNVTDYYANLARRYQDLGVQVRGLISQATQQFDYQATLNLQDLASILSKRQAQGFVEAKTFADQLKQYQNLMAQAQYPKDYLQIIKSASSTMQSLHLMGSTYDNLTALHLTIRQLQSSHLDVTALQQEEQYDLQLFRSANVPERFVQLNDLINTQLDETVAFSTQAIPYVGAAKLSQLSSEIATLKQYGQDTSAFQKRLNADQTALDQARMMGDFLKVSSQIDDDVAAIQLPLVQGQANYLLKQFHREVTNWGSSHQYHDSYDNTSYPLDYEYDQQEGFGSDADVAVQSAQTLDDYQAAINTINDDMTNLKAMEADYNDKTPWDQQHATDKQLMQYYNATTGQVIVVSLVEQTLRLYQDGKLVKAFLITSGQFAKPSPPGFWHIFLRQSPTVFKSSEPKGSAFWYPDTKINYAMEYHDDGYYFHDSWWRYYYGPGTNFPHYDPGGEEFAGTGSHGCINMQQDQAAWLYANTGYGTAVIMY